MQYLGPVYYQKDSKDVFRFVAIQSDLGKEIIEYLGINVVHVDGIILYLPKVAYYTKAEAALVIAKDLKGLISLVSYFRIIPNFLKTAFIILSLKIVINGMGKRKLPVAYSRACC